MQPAGQVPYLYQNDAHEQSLGQSDGSLSGPEQTLNQSISMMGLSHVNLIVKLGMWASERHYVFDCPSFDDIRMLHSRPFDDSHGAMRLFMWHSHQKGVASCLLQMLDKLNSF